MMETWQLTSFIILSYPVLSIMGIVIAHNLGVQIKVLKSSIFYNKIL